MKTIKNKYIISFFVSAVFVLSFLLYFNNDNNKVNPSIKEKDNEHSELAMEIKREKMRNNYFFTLLRDPKTNSIPANVRQRDLRFAANMNAGQTSLSKSQNTLATDWKLAGPYSVGGRTRAVGIDIDNSDNIIAGGVSGGIWRSTDKGVSWQQKSPISDVQGITSIVQDIRQGSNSIWYCSSGEIGNTAEDQGGTANFYGGGIWKSTDNGETWNIIQSTIPSTTEWNSVFSVTSRIIMNPNTGSIFVASNAGVIEKSTDGGDSWNSVLGLLNNHQ